VGDSGVWKTTDGGTSWIRLSGGLPAFDMGRVDLAIKPTDAQVLYAVFEKASTRTHLGTYRSNNGGSSWTSLPLVPPGGTCQDWSFDDICTYENQFWGLCNYALYIEVGQTGTVWLGGVALWRSTDEGSTWIDSCSTDMHVDQHAATFSSNGKVWVGNDGGVFATEDDGASWSNRNPGLRTAQFYPGTSLHPANADFALGGTQDNGTHRYSGSPSWNQVYTGDGAFSAIDFNDPDNVWYVSLQYLSIYKTTDAGANVFPAVSGLSDAGSLFAPFIAPFVMCPSDATVLVAGSDNVWRTNDGAASWQSNSPDPLVAAFQTIRAIAFAPSETACDTYFVGMTNGKVFRTTTGGGLTGWTDITGGLPGAGVADFAVDQADGNTVYVALSGFGTPHVYRSGDALSPTPTWTSISTGLPDTPVDSILIDPDDSTILYIGTDIGIFRSDDTGASWQPFMEGHPNVAVFDLVADSSTGTLISFTHGRGAFRLTAACTPPDFGGVDSASDPDTCSSGILVNWTEPSSWGQGAGSGTYDVRRYETAGCSGAFTPVASELPASTISFTDMTAAPGVDYYYQVVATNDCDTPESSAGAVSCSAVVTEVSDTTPCGDVGETLLVGRDASNANLTWTAVACDDLAHYAVYGSASYDAPFPEGWTLLGTPAGASFDDPLGSANAAYKTISVDLCGNSSGN
jgi:photosystem II stability/assembly factor-like uncharacterized protein